MYLLTQGEDQEGQEQERDTGRSQESDRSQKSQETPRSQQGQTTQQEQDISTHPPDQGEGHISMLSPIYTDHFLPSLVYSPFKNKTCILSLVRFLFSCKSGPILLQIKVPQLLWPAISSCKGYCSFVFSFFWHLLLFI